MPFISNRLQLVWPEKCVGHSYVRVGPAMFLFYAPPRLTPHSRRPPMTTSPQDGQTPLLYAAGRGMHGVELIVVALIAGKADIDARTKVCGAQRAVGGSAECCFGHGVI